MSEDTSNQNLSSDQPSADVKQTSPEMGQAGNEVKTDQAPLKDAQTSDLPDRFKGRTAEEIARDYMELQKTMGEQSKLVQQSKQYLQERDFLNRVLDSNPDLYQSLQKAISGNNQGKASESKTSKSDGEAISSREVAELRSVAISNMVDNFKKSFGIADLPKDKADKLMHDVSNSLAEMVDPSGVKDMRTILSEVNVNYLPKMLENAFYLAKKDILADKGELKPDLASIGMIPSSSSTGKSDVVKLTEQEKVTAQKMGISEEKYLEGKLKNR